jgi:hypothetical protein
MKYMHSSVNFIFSQSPHSDLISKANVYQSPSPSSNLPIDEEKDGEQLKSEGDDNNDSNTESNCVMF